MAREFRVSERDLRGRGISAPLTFARDELCRRLRAMGFTYPEIGRFLGDRTHSAIIAAVRRAEERIADTS